MIETNRPQPSVEHLAEEFLARYRRGERPALSEYTRNYPALADEIREVFSALAILEEALPRELDPPAAYRGRITADGKTPRQLGDYRIIREIGRGGMGVVYEAVQEALGRHVALKVLPYEASANSIWLQRFTREARSAARLHHTNIVPVFDVGEHQGVHYYAMQFIQGQGLDEVLIELRRLRGGRQPPDKPSSLAVSLAEAVCNGKFEAADPVCEEQKTAEHSLRAGAAPVTSGPPDGELPDSQTACASSDTHASSSILQSQSELSSRSSFTYYRSVARLGLQVAQALAYAHEQKVLHRDIKPANLLLDLHGTIWVTDFGLAKDEGEDLTQTGDVVGTLRYLAPERFSGVSDARGDLYSLGLTLYEILSLRPAFDEQDRGRLIRRITQEEPPSPRKFDRRIPRDLETIILKAIAREPKRRYQSAEEMAEDLGRFLADRPVLARRATWVEQSWRWSRRNPWYAGLAATVLGLLAVVAVVSSVAAIRLSRERSAVVSANEQATSNLWAAYLEQARAGRASGRPGQRVHSLDAVRSALQLKASAALSDEDRLKLRNEAIACMALWDFWPGRRCSGIEGHTNLFWLNPAGETFAYVAKQGEVKIGKVAEDQEIDSIAMAGKPADSLQYSPDGRFLAIGSQAGNQLQIWDTLGHRFVLTRPAAKATCTFTPDSRRVALGQADGTVSICALPGGNQLRRFSVADVPAQLAISPDGRQLAVCSGLAEVQVWDLESGKRARKFQFGSIVKSMAFHPDGRGLAVGLVARRAEIWDLASGQLRAAMTGHFQDVVWLAFHPSGEVLATGSWDNHTRLWSAATGRLLIDWPSGMQSPGFSQDGRVLGCFLEGDNVRLAEVAGGHEYGTLVSDRGAGQLYDELEISPDGRLLAVGMGDGVRLWELPSQRQVAFLPIGEVRCAVFTPNGRELLTSGKAGLLRWPMTAGAAGEVRIHPPRSIPLPIYAHDLELHPDGRTLLVGSDRDQPAVIVDLSTQSIRTRLGLHPGAHFQTLSRDQRWVATSGWHATGVKIWDAHTGALARELPLGLLTYAYFTPDSKTLITTSGGEHCFWNVATGELVRRLPMEIPYYPGLVAFSPDERLVALERSPGVISLLELTTLRTLAKLEDPSFDRAHFLRFSPDGGSLVTVAYYARALHVWNLRAIGKELTGMGLAFDEPLDSLVSGASQKRSQTSEAVSGGPASATPGVLTVRVEPGVAAIVAAAKEDRMRRKIEDERRAYKASPEDARVCNNLAWWLATAPASLRNSAEALRLAEKAVRLKPGDVMYANTLGLAQYRCGQYRAAITTLEPNLRGHGDSVLPYDLYFLAMSYQRLSDAAHARELFTMALRWSESHGGPDTLNAEQLEEFASFRAEAEALLGQPANPPGQSPK